MSQQSLLGVEQYAHTTDDYYTPEWVFDGLGIEFDLDPASPPGGVDYIPTKRFLTKGDDGLNAAWEGKIWLNPPFSEMSPWARRWIGHGNGVILAPVSKAAWPSEVWNAADLVWLPRTAIRFGTPEGSTSLGGVPVSLFSRVCAVTSVLLWVRRARAFGEGNYDEGRASPSRV